MKSFGSRIGILMLGAGLLSACKRDATASQNPPSPSAPATTTAPAVATAAPPAPAASAPAEAPTKPVDKVCPFPRRCNDACKKAHFAAVDACSPEWKVIEQSVPSLKEMGECTARCLKVENIAGCVGAANKSECDCTEKCLEGVPPAIRDKGEPYLRCYANAVRAACY
jgi:hypothetical protein